MARKWLTPDLPPESIGYVTRSIEVPETLISFVSGAFFLLTQAHNWEQEGDATPEDMEMLFLEVFENYSKS